MNTTDDDHLAPCEALPHRDIASRRFSEGCRIAEAAVDSALRRWTMTVLGVDVDDKESIAEFQSDLRFGRAARVAMLETAVEARRTAVRWGVTAMIVLLGYGVVEWVKRVLAH
jgi:hypothetical protein